MRKSLIPPSALSIALLSGPALAVGFGELTLLSRVGEPLRAEVGIVSTGQEPIETACFSLAPMREADMPVVTSARLQLAKDGRNYRLIISGKPVADPVFMIALRAGCGFELQRDFVLMPQAPLTMAEALPVQPPPGVSGDSTRPVPGQQWQASQGETLESIAENLAPDDMIKQRRMLVALRRANPGLESSDPLAEGTTVRIPRLRKQAVSEPHARGDVRQAQRPVRSNEDQAEATPPPARPQAAKAKPSAKPVDRLVLTAAPADLRPGEKPSPPRGSLPEMEERMLKMETTLHLLNEEISKLNQALSLTTEALAAQQKLQAVQSAAQEVKATEKDKAVLSVPAPAALPQPSGGSWMELLLSALAGGLIAASGAHFLVLRRKNAVDKEIPLAVQTSRPHSVAEPAQPAVAPLAKPVVAPVPRPVVEDFADQPLGSEPEADNVQVTEDDSNSLLKIAEIMLSFGRVHDAAETLSQYIKEASPKQVQPWIMLLDLYRRGNMPKEFAVLASRMRERFNIHVPTWDEAKVPDDGLKSLEGYPHIVGYLEQAWGRQECLEFLQDLVTDNRSGKRVGFPLEVVEEIVLLMRVLEDGHRLQRA